MTSNVGFNDINIVFNKKEDSVLMSKLKENFSIPFVNRIDNIITFNYLTKDNIQSLINKKLKAIKEKYKKKNIEVKLGNKVINEIINLSNYKEYGARKLDKIIKDKVDNYIIDEVIDGNKVVHLQSLKESVHI